MLPDALDTDAVAAAVVLRDAHRRWFAAFEAGDMPLCSCGDEHQPSKKHHASRHLFNAAQRLLAVADETRTEELVEGLPQTRFLVYGTPRPGGKIMEVCIGSAASEDEAFEKAGAWVVAQVGSPAAFVFAPRGSVYKHRPFELLDEIEALL